ncbi:hypothetical protein PN497_03065 [Sphaerospermopsis kisseleviana CS-549]|uniref:Transposase (putative) YhgA-like domain-containing protein n=1 Tax=Sphaerospermopsis kisseleviana CS-549 TaxID=3021783 RepID=A0ABT4ZLY0_9CYAN|nr:hypothetical protein [Sphaerospermopsis kisseleviana]MDB9440361.1 hypothetical protein [Sphaerospermopsis kisseleviana CS-549]BAZ79950.1 hypothetical protein NIES73_11980 [Sphaerospermopsis kisseleviana NIES-73]
MTETTANYDQTWKEAITQYFESFIQFFYPNLHQKIDWSKTPISLDKELEQITASSQTKKRYADKLFQVWLLNNEIIWILIHIEVQSQYDKEFTQRMYIYNYRSFDLFHKPVISLAILGDEDAKWRPNNYEYGIDDSFVKMQFSIVKLLDYQWEELTTSNNLFAIIVMAHLKTKATTKDFTQREQWKWNIVRPLYQKGLTRFDIINLVKFIDKMMTLPPPLQTTFNQKLEQHEKELNMPFISPIEEMAEERGEAKGARKNCQNNIIKILSNRFNNVPELMSDSLKKIEDMTILENLLLASISVNSLEEFQKLIDAELQQNQ